MSPARSEDATFDPGAALRLAGRESAGLPERLEALKHLIETFFGGSSEKVVSALVGGDASSLSDDELDRISELIEKAKRERR